MNIEYNCPKNYQTLVCYAVSTNEELVYVKKNSKERILWAFKQRNQKTFKMQIQYKSITSKKEINGKKIIFNF